MNIKRRGIKCDTLCVCCKRLDEDGAHLFLKCKDAKNVWEALGMGVIRDDAHLFPRNTLAYSSGFYLREIVSLLVQVLVSWCS